MQAQSYSKQDYSGGLNSTASLRQVSPAEATVLQNWDITYQGQLKRRDGLLLLGNTTPNTTIQGLGAFIRDSGVDLLRFQNTNIEYLNGSIWSALNTGMAAGQMMWFENVQSLNRIYFCNENNPLQYWDRSSTTGTTTPAGTLPHGNVMIWYKNFMFHLNNVKVGTTYYREDLFWSALGDPNTYDTTNNHTTVPGDGQLITAVPLADKLVLFKERSVQYLSGWGNASWQITSSASSYASLAEEVGCIAPRGAVQVGDEVWFMDNQARIRRITQTDFSAFRQDIISKKIQGTLDGINKAQLAKTIAYTWNNKVYFEVPNGSDTQNSLVLVFDILASKRNTPNAYSYVSEAWTTYTNWSHSCATTYPTSESLDLYLGDSNTGSVYKHAGPTDNGVPINAVFEDGEQDFGLSDQDKNYIIGRFTASASGSSNVYIDSSIDGGNYINLGALQLAATGSRVGPTGTAKCGPTGSARVGGRSTNELRYQYDVNGQFPVGKRIRHRIRHQDLTQPTVNAFSSNFRPQSLR